MKRPTKVDRALGMRGGPHECEICHKGVAWESIHPCVCCLMMVCSNHIFKSKVAPILEFCQPCSQKEARGGDPFDRTPDLRLVPDP